MSLRNTVEFAQVALCLVPKILDSVNVIIGIREEFGVVDPKMLGRAKLSLTKHLKTKVKSENVDKGRRKSTFVDFSPEPNTETISYFSGLCEKIGVWASHGPLYPFRPHLPKNKRIPCHCFRRNPHRFGLQVIVNRVEAAFATEAALFVATKWRGVADGAVGVDPDGSCFQFL